MKDGVAIHLPQAAVGEADISFYTGDITRAFKVVVQGVRGGDMLSGEEAFVVR